MRAPFPMRAFFPITHGASIVTPRTSVLLSIQIPLPARRPGSAKFTRPSSMSRCARPVKLGQLSQIDVGQSVAGHHQEGPAVQRGADLFDAAGGAEQRGFMGIRDPDAEVAAVLKMVLDQLRMAVEIENQLGDAV